MAVINEITEVLHKIEAKLYPNYLGQGESTYVARAKYRKLFAQGIGFDSNQGIDSYSNESVNWHPIGGLIYKAAARAYSPNQP